MPEKQKLSPIFGNDNFSVSTPGTVAIDELTSFLDTDPDNVTEIQNEPDNKEPKNKVPEEVTKGKEKPEAQLKDNPFKVEDLYSDEEDNKEPEEEPILKKKVPEKEESTDESPYTTLSKDLLNLGVFTTDEDEEGNEVVPTINSAEDFLKQFQSEIKKQAGSSIQKFLEQFGPEYSEMFDAVFVNGVPPYEYISRQAKIENIENFDIESEDNQEKIVRQWYLSEGRTPEAIEAKIQKLKNYGDLEEEAKEAQGVLAQKEQRDLASLAEQKQQETQKRQRAKSEYLSNIHKIISDKLTSKDFDGIPVDKRFAEQTKNYLTRDVYQTPDKQLLTEFDKDILDLNKPENNQTKVKLAMILQMLKSDPTLSKLSKRAVSKETNKLFSEVERKFGKAKPSSKEQEVLNNW
jgi:hypothetical protein